MADKRQESLTGQLQQARTQLSATETNLARAESDLQRTTAALKAVKGCLLTQDYSNALLT